MSVAASQIYTTRYQRLMREFPLRQLRTKKDAEAATEILDQLFREEFNDVGEEAYVTTLAQLLADYEEEHEPTPDAASEVDVLKHLMDENDMTQAALAEALGASQSLVSMILAGERPITLEHAKRLGARFHVDPVLFINLR